MRLFIAIRMDEEMKKALLGAQDALRSQGISGLYAPETNFHLTLAFIGEYPEPDAVQSVLQSVPLPPMTLRLDGYGSFGRAWWMGLTPNAALTAYADKLREAMKQAGIPFDPRPFVPHISLLFHPTGAASPDGLPLPQPHTGMAVSRVSLLRSDPGLNGMIYTELSNVSSTTADQLSSRQSII